MKRKWLEEVKKNYRIQVIRESKWEERLCRECGMPVKVWKAYKGSVVCDYCKRSMAEERYNNRPDVLLKKYSRPPVVRLADVLEVV